MPQPPFGLDDFNPGGGDWPAFLPMSQGGGPAVDIYQDKNNVYVEVSLNGIKPENIEVSVEDNILVVQGKTSEEKETQEKDYLRKEIRRGAFKRVIKLPVEVKSKKALAEFHNGLLKVSIPKNTGKGTKATKVPIQIK